MPAAAHPGYKRAKYTIGDREMAAGSTLGSPMATLIVKPTGAIEKIFAPRLGCDVFGTLVLHHWDCESGVPLVARPGAFEVFPCNQQHIFQLSNGVKVTENIFLLSRGPRGKDLHEVDPPAAYYAVDLVNESERPVTMSTYGSVRLRGSLGGQTAVSYDKRAHAFLVKNGKHPDLVRSASCSRVPDSYEATLDAAKASAPSFPGRLSCTVLESGDDPIGIFHLENDLKPEQHARFWFVLTFAEDGNLQSLPDADDAYEATAAYYDSVLDRAVILTPDQEVNRGALWAKANILRTQSLTSQGWCFVNDPARSNNSVARDTAWYAFGADYLTPHFTRESLLWYLDHVEPSGMVVEYFDIRNGKTDDYGLNINDNTPLIILALWHHYCVTGDRGFLEYVFPRARRLAEYILSQRDKHGLVWCTAHGTADWGIIGWRNIIEGYRLSGATTEVNSECFAALNTMCSMAEELGDAVTAQAYRKDATALKDAVNEHLLDKSRNLYYLNIDLDGTPRTDVTCDLVFPVMFGVADREVASNIISRMSSPDFWSEAGMHTVPRNDINYAPKRGHGLLGGIWSGPTFWYAFAASRFNPEFMAYALSASFKHYSQDPLRNNTVPGQFSEWLHGETLTNQGMMLSPWFAPKYLWSALEGAAGLDVSLQDPQLAPKPAGTWLWIAARNVSVRGKDAAWFALRIDGLHTFANYPFEGLEKDRLFEEDISGEVQVNGDTAVCVALRSKDRVAILAGNTFERTVNVGLRLDISQYASRAHVRRYDTLRNEWLEIPDFDMRKFADGFPVQISRHGFCFLELHMSA